MGDDWQAIYRFSGAQLSLTTAFHHYFGEGDRSDLDTTYRFNSRIGEIANRFIQQNPHQLAKPLNSLRAGDKSGHPAGGRPAGTAAGQAQRLREA